MAMTMDSVCELIVDTKHKTPKFIEQGYPCIRTPNIGRGYFILDNAKYVSEESYKEWTERAVPSEGDLIFAREAPVGNVAILPRGLKVCHGQRTVLIRPDNTKVDSHYLMYLMLSDELQNRMLSMASGATVPHLNMSDIRLLDLPELPQLEEQKEISHILSSYDNLIENNNRRISILEEMAQSLYREWFVKFRFPGHENTKFNDTPLGKIPEGWVVKTLGELVNFKRNSVKKGELSEPTAYMGLEHFPRKSLALSDWEEVTEIGSSKLVFKRGDILFGKIRPYFHKVGVAQVDGICSSDTFVLEATDKKYHALISMVTFSDEFVAHSVQTSQGTKMPRANWDVLSNYVVMIPKNGLLDVFNEVVDISIEQLRAISTKNRNLTRQRDLLLPKLISGKIDFPSENN